MVAYPVTWCKSEHRTRTITTITKSETVAVSGTSHLVQGKASFEGRPNG